MTGEFLSLSSLIKTLIMNDRIVKSRQSFLEWCALKYYGDRTSSNVVPFDLWDLIIIKSTVPNMSSSSMLLLVDEYIATYIE